MQADEPLTIKQIPTIITPPILEAYPFLDPIAFELVPHHWSDVEILLRLRNGTATWPNDLPFVLNGKLAQPVTSRREDSVLSKNAQWEALEYNLQKDNVEVLCDVFARMQPRRTQVSEVDQLA